jgi:hypothetical protein
MLQNTNDSYCEFVLTGYENGAPKGEFRREKFPKNSSVKIDLPADTAIHRLPSARFLMNPTGEKTLVHTTDADHVYSVRGDSHAFVTLGRLSQDGEVMPVVFGAFLRKRDEEMFYQWAAKNTKAMVEAMSRLC